MKRKGKKLAKKKKNEIDVMSSPPILMQGNQAIAEGALAAGCNFLLATQLLPLQKLQKLWQKSFQKKEALLYKWKTK